MVRSGESVHSGLSNSPPSSDSSPPPSPTPTITTRKAVGGRVDKEAASFATPNRPSTLKNEKKCQEKQIESAYIIAQKGVS